MPVAYAESGTSGPIERAENDAARPSVTETEHRSGLEPNLWINRSAQMYVCLLVNAHRNAVDVRGFASLHVTRAQLDSEVILQVRRLSESLHPLLV